MPSRQPFIGRGYGREAMTYDEVLDYHKSILEAVHLEVHPADFKAVAEGLQAAAQRNQYWPLIHLQGNKTVPRGVILWMKSHSNNPKNSTNNLMNLAELDLSNLPIPNSSPSPTKTSSA